MLKRLNEVISLQVPRGSAFVLVFVLGPIDGLVTQSVQWVFEGTVATITDYMLRMFCATFAFSSGLGVCAVVSQKINVYVLLCGLLSGVLSVLHTSSPVQAASAAATFGALYAVA